ncbi:type II secretion system F family protein [Flavobacterium sp. RHBU_24]|uniref:type II secretion system F family protein n=1 Tax=Flavobacterium sp. RHBU_24 TaxID=3391185 RepID=UPI0039852B0F
MSIDLSSYKTLEAKGKSSKASFDFSLSFGKKFTDKKKESFYRELGMLLRAGVDFKKALEILHSQTKNKNDAAMLLDIKNKIVSGKSIYEALFSSGQFSAYEYFSIQIGEETHKLEVVLSELQKYFASKIQMRRQIISVLTYPVIVLVVTILVLYFMLTKVVPMFTSVFRQFNSELPKSTQYIIKLSNNSGLFFSILFGLIIALIVLHATLNKKNSYRNFTSAMVMRLPYFGQLVKKIYLARFCQSMSLLLTSKTQLINSLKLTAKMVGFYPLELSIKYIVDDVTKGRTLTESFRKHRVYEDRMVSMIEVAEQVNQLDVMFEKLTEQYNEDINHKTKMIGVVLEPMIIIVIGIVVGVIMISMYAPMFDLSKIIRN